MENINLLRVIIVTLIFITVTFCLAPNFVIVNHLFTGMVKAAFIIFLEIIYVTKFNKK